MKTKTKTTSTTTATATPEREIDRFCSPLTKITPTPTIAAIRRTVPPLHTRRVHPVEPRNRAGLCHRDAAENAAARRTGCRLRRRGWGIVADMAGDVFGLNRRTFAEEIIDEAEAYKASSAGTCRSGKRRNIISTGRKLNGRSDAKKLCAKASGHVGSRWLAFDTGKTICGPQDRWR